MSVMRYLYGPSRRNVLSCFPSPACTRRRRRRGSGPPPPPYPPPLAVGNGRGRRAPSLDQRQYVELVERRRRRQRPFEGGRARSPRIVGRSFLADEGAHHSVEEDQHADAGDI